ncbi:uncharacterized protein BBA_10269 [Beauveria bassiana ARSEF 2860]|uniref:Uncharacterized protein n=1 Tax=Beauveria bassiana (strain ARSEF 2860) TaxID=655819 RepID=J4UES7_BEAB2|nr:uncharacterized protein BBA_10269 [Beauveria bassiana ARSEF 2860]EJP60782.1 hypothetical protein BBA_10269 [Beauveria bassiana ARSEF 2860]
MQDALPEPLNLAGSAAVFSGKSMSQVERYRVAMSSIFGTWIDRLDVRSPRSYFLDRWLDGSSPRSWGGHVTSPSFLGADASDPGPPHSAPRTRRSMERMNYGLLTRATYAWVPGPSLMALKKYATLKTFSDFIKIRLKKLIYGNSSHVSPEGSAYGSVWEVLGRQVDLRSCQCVHYG